MVAKREQIILADIAILESLTVLTTVERTLPTWEKLNNFASTQFPVAAIVGGIPSPINNKFSKETGQVEQITSELKNEIYFYLQENDNADSVISTMLNTVWAALYSNPKRSGLCRNTVLKPSPNSETWAPFVAFNISCIHIYIHTPGGI